MAPVIPLLIFAVEVVAIVAVGQALLYAAAVGGKMAAVWVALVIGVILSIAVYIGSKGGTPQSQESSHSRGGHH